MMHYRIKTKTSWVIYIGIEAILLSNKTKNSFHVINNLSLDLSNVNNLHPDEELLIAKGIKWVSDYVPNNGQKTIFIKEVALVACDYQKEILFFAMANWLSKEFDFKMPQFEFSYNKSTNKYEFPLLESKR